MFRNDPKGPLICPVSAQKRLLLTDHDVQTVATQKQKEWSSTSTLGRVSLFFTLHGSVTSFALPWIFYLWRKPDRKT